jgi:hypothetical protein
MDQHDFVRNNDHEATPGLGRGRREEARKKNGLRRAARP